jgi:hypothetical protein
MPINLISGGSFWSFTSCREERASAVGLGIPDLPEVTPACLDALADGRIVRLDQARVLNDFKLLQISWVYDLNFATTRRLLLEREYLPKLAATLPDTPPVTAGGRTCRRIAHGPFRSGITDKVCVLWSGIFQLYSFP